MPTYNYGQYIGDAIHSVLTQTHQDFELFVVDDGSTDDTGTIVAGFDDPRVISVRLVNGGVSRARNHALDLARGDALAFLDADDLWLPHKLESQVQVLREEPAVGFVATNFVRFSSDGTELNEQFSFMPRTVHLARRTSGRRRYGILPGNALVALCTEAEMPWYPSANLVRRSIAQDLRFPESLRLGEDLHYFNRVWARTRAALVFDVGLKLRRHDSNSSSGAGLTHSPRTIHEFNGVLQLELSAEQRAAVRRRLALEWSALGWRARQEGRLSDAVAAYEEACRTGGATPRMRVSRVLAKLYAALNKSPTSR
jgi:glycosyltransferase involved in cell wall biosynthesis